MAITKVQIIVSKVAEQGEYKNRVITGWETFQITVKGEPVTKKRLWTMWLEYPADIIKADVVEFEGELGTKAGTYEKDGNTYQTVEHSLNKPRWVKIHAAVPGTQTTPVVDDGQQPF